MRGVALLSIETISRRAATRLTAQNLSEIRNSIEKSRTTAAVRRLPHAAALTRRRAEPARARELRAARGPFVPEPPWSSPHRCAGTHHGPVHTVDRCRVPAHTMVQSTQMCRHTVEMLIGAKDL
jgi:hypothetical protein